LDEDTGLYYFGARYYDARTSVWASVDPILGSYLGGKAGMGGVFNSFNLGLYSYSHLNPVKFIDPDGNSPVRNLAGNVGDFTDAMDTSPTKIGLTKGREAENALLRLGMRTGFPPKPATTPYFNESKGRYIYTKRGGWVDMVHFLYYAGVAYGSRSTEIDPIYSIVMPGGKADAQEFSDPPYSAYSPEDIPSDGYGADFAIRHFDPNSNLTLSQQIGNYLTNVLGAVSDPKIAPNWNSLAKDHPSLKDEVLSGKRTVDYNFGPYPQDVYPGSNPYVVRDGEGGGMF